MGCVNLETLLGALEGLTDSLGTTVDLYKETTSSFNPTTGVVTKGTPATYLDIPAIELAGGQTQQGQGLTVDSDTAIIVIAGSAVTVSPSANDRVEKPAASIRSSPTDYVSYRVQKVDKMIVGGSVFQYTLTMASA